MKKIWKYYLYEGKTVLDMPVGANSLHVGLQNNRSVLWALVDPNAKLEYRIFRGYPTGEHLVNIDSSRYIGTVQNPYANDTKYYVLHFFEEVRNANK